MRNSPGSFTGAVLGTICLAGGIILRIWAPEFSGFFDRGHSEPVIPVWILLLVLAVVNYLYAAISYFVLARATRASAEALPRPHNGDREP